jgi:hypothetical protein
MGEKESIITSASIIASPEPGGYWLSVTGSSTSTSTSTSTSSSSGTSTSSGSSR